MKTYIQAIGENWPDVKCYATGNNYEDIVWVEGAPLPSQDELNNYINTPNEDDYIKALTAFMDAKAAERKYDSIMNAAIRAGYPGAYHAEGVAYAIWMDACWSVVIRVLTQIQAGTMTPPTIGQLLEALPELVLP